MIMVQKRLYFIEDLGDMFEALKKIDHIPMDEKIYALI